MTPSAGPVEVDRLFHRHLLTHVATRADQPAIVSARTTLTYGDLARLSEDYAGVLDDHGLRAGDVVVVETEPRPPAVALLMGLSRRAVTFVCMSPDLPRARKENIVRRVGARAYVRSRPGPEFDGVLPGCLDDDGELTLTGSVSPRSEPRGPCEADLAYIVFTSGSTGEPKGIMMSHRAVVSFWRAASGFGVRPGVRLGTMAPLQFDLALLDLGLALGAGGTLVQLSSLLSHQPAGFIRALDRYSVEHMSGVPAIWQALLASEDRFRIADLALDTVLYAGEGFSAGGLRRLRSAKPSLRIVNCFGHSESIASCLHVLGESLTDAHGRVSFGTAAIAGMSLYLVDATGALVTEPEQVGELYIEGDALCDGYWQDPAGTARAFVPSPLRGPGVRAFRTRDLGYRDAAGHHYFHSRADTQVKLLGNRIELEEIDVQLRSHPGVIEATTVLGGSEQPRLVSFVQCAAGEDAPGLDDLRRRCIEFLPRAMVPTAFFYLEEWPVTPNGKIDREALVRRSQGQT